MAERQDTATSSTPTNESNTQEATGTTRRRRKRKRGTQKVSQGRGWDRFELPVYEPMKIQGDDEPQSDNFGNSIDYEPSHGSGIGGYYREPMDGGNRWAQQSRRSHSRYHQISQEGVLTMRQPGWQRAAGIGSGDETFQHDEHGLTIRQHSDLSRSLRYEQDPHQTTQLSRHEQNADPAHAWHRFISDLKRGQTNTRRKRQEERRRRRQRNRPRTSQ